MKKTFALAIWACLLALGAESAHDLLQKALVRERTEGNLPEAIKLYRLIVEKHANERKVAAQALLQLGQCHEKLGQADARKAYERLLREYAEQSDLVAEARTRLAVLGQGAGGKGTTVRQVLAGSSEDPLGGPSLDGRYFTLVDWQSGNLALRDLTTGQDRRLTSEGTWEKPQQWAEYSIMSPDGRQVAYVWYAEDEVCELRVVALDGSKPRVLLRVKTLGYVWPNGWTPDSKQILTSLSDRRTGARIAFISAADGSVKVVKTLAWVSTDRMSLSPDGQQIAYSVPGRAGARDRDIFLLSADGSSEVTLVEHPSDDRHPAWTPDGKQVLFASDRTGVTGLWSVAVSEGRPAGPPQMVRPGLGRMRASLGVTRQGSYYYTLDTAMEDVYLAEMDPESGKLVKPPEPLPGVLGSRGASVFSRDGRQLAYFSRRGGFSRPGDAILVTRSVETGEEREVPYKPRFLVAGTASWFPDGRSLLTQVWEDPPRKLRFYHVDTQTGEARLIKEVLTPPGFRPELSPDGKTLFYWLPDDPESPKTVRLMARQIESGQEREITRASRPRMGRLACSPDNRWLAFVTPGRPAELSIVPVSGGEVRQMGNAGDLESRFGGEIAWTPDGRYLLVVRRTGPPENKSQLWRVPIEGGEPQPVGPAMEEIRFPSVHPDGRRISFTAGSTSRPEVWVMENFLPGLRAER